MGQRTRNCLELLPAPGPQPAGPAAEAYRPFPVEVLPDAVGRFVAEAARVLGCDAAQVALPALAVTASLVGNSRTVRLREGWEEPCVVWSAVVGERGALRSSARARVLAPLFVSQKGLLLEHRRDLADYRRAVRTGRPPEETAERQWVGHDGRPAWPVLTRRICAETTVDRVAAVLEENPRGTLVVCDDLAGWLGWFSRPHVRQSGRDLAAWRTVHAAGPLFLERRVGGQGYCFVARAAASLTGALLPGALAGFLAPEAPAAGLVARLLLAMPPPAPRAGGGDNVEAETAIAFNGLFHQLPALGFADPNRAGTPFALPLSAGAKAVWSDFYAGQAQEPAACGSALSAALSKLTGYAARLALWHHVVSFAARGENDLVPVGPESVAAGVTLARWFATETRRIHATLSPSSEENETRHLAELIRSRGGRISVRGLIRLNNRRYPDVATAELALGGLVELGLAHWSADPCQNGSPSEREVVHDA